MEVREFIDKTTVVFIVTVFCFFPSHCSPARALSYREGVEQEPKNTTSKLSRDRLSDRNDQSKIIPSNPDLRTRIKELSELARDQNVKVKSVLPGENTMWQTNDEFYDGLYDEINVLDYPEPQDQLINKKEKPQDVMCKPQDSVPMMIIRQVDMVAMKIPVQDAKDLKNFKESKDSKDSGILKASKGFKAAEDSRSCKASRKTDVRGRSRLKEWSEWSPCSRPCGKGVQSRWRNKPGLQEREQQFRPCNLGDCSNSRDFQLHPSYP